MPLEITTSSPQILSAIRLSLGNSFNSTPSTSSIQPFIGNSTASGNYSSILGGSYNTAQGNYSSILGGSNNVSSGQYSAVLGGRNNNTNGQENTFILGSNIVAHESDYTYVNNLSSVGDLVAAGNVTALGDIIATGSLQTDGYIAVAGPVFALGGDSENWNNAYSTVKQQSANNVSGFNTLSSLSGIWSSSYITLCSLSGQWQQSVATTSSLALSAPSWNVITTLVQGNSSVWGTGGVPITLGTIPQVSGHWDTSYAWVQSNSSTASFDRIWISTDNPPNNFISAPLGLIDTILAYSISSVAISGTFYGDGSKLFGTGGGSLPANATFQSVSAISLSGTFYGDGSKLIGAALPGQQTINTIVTNNSGNWNSAYDSTTTLNLSATQWNSAYASTVSLNLSSAQWNSTSTALNLSSARWNTAYNNSIYTINGTANQINVTGSGNNTVTLSLPNSAVFPGDVAIIGNLSIAGSATYVNTQNLIVGDNLLYLNNNNYGNNLFDTGFVSHFSQAPLGYQHTGLVRRANQPTGGVWTLFSGLTTEPASATNIDWSDRNIVVDSLSANILGNLSGSYVTVGTGNSDQWNTAYNTSTSYQNASGSYVTSNATYGAQIKTILTLTQAQYNALTIGMTPPDPNTLYIITA